MNHEEDNQHPFIPDEAFLYFPNSSDDFKIGSGKKARRFIFQGGVEYDDFEKDNLKKLEEAILNKQIHVNQFWDISWKLRFLASTGFDIKQTLIDIEIFDEYRKKAHNITITPKIENYLKMGLFYVAGRDAKYRPILVFNMSKVISSQITQQDLIELQTYFFEWVLKNLFISGQIENWIALVDSGNQNFFSVAGPLKRSVSFLSNTFRSRMYACYAVNASTSVFFLWRVVKAFLHEDTIKKINIFQEPLPNPLFQYANPSQIQIKYGGTRPNIEQYWPFVVYSNDYKIKTCPIILKSISQYRKLQKQGKLYKRKIKKQPFYLEKEQKTKKQQQQLTNRQKQKQKQKQKIKLPIISDNKVITDFLKETDQFIDRHQVQELPVTQFHIQFLSPISM